MGSHIPLLPSPVRWFTRHTWFLPRVRTVLLPLLYFCLPPASSYITFVALHLVCFVTWRLFAGRRCRTACRARHVSRCAVLLPFTRAHCWRRAWRTPLCARAIKRSGSARAATVLARAGTRRAFPMPLLPATTLPFHPNRRALSFASWQRCLCLSSCPCVPHMLLCPSHLLTVSVLLHSLCNMLPAIHYNITFLILTMFLPFTFLFIPI